MRKHKYFAGQSKRSLFKVSLFFVISLTTFTRGTYAQESSSLKEETIQGPLQEKIADLAWNGKLEEIKAIVDKDKNRINCKLNNDETLLTIAAYKGDLDLAQYVITKGIDIKAKNRWSMDGLLNASVSGSSKIACLLIENGTDINVRGGGENTPLLFAIKNNHADVVKLLLDKGANIDLRDTDNLPPIVYASYYMNPEIIKMLVEHGADINFTTLDNSSILHNVSYSGSADLIDFIIKKGANVNVVDQSGFSPLHIAIQNGNTEAISILCKNTKNLNQKEIRYGNTPLHFAALKGDLESSIMLIESGADAGITNLQGISPVDYAVKYGYEKLTSYYQTINLADSKSIEQTKANIEEVNRKANTDEVKIWYTGHSGWALQFKDKVVIMDYWANGQTRPALSLANGNINPLELKDKTVYIFVSHDHSDHYDTTIYAWKSQIKNIKYIYGFSPEKSEVHHSNGYHGPSYTYIEDNQTAMVDDIKVTTIKSDDTGQGFLLELNGMKIFHPGDHAQFNAEIAADYKKEIDFLAEKTNHVDIAFLPVTGCPSRWQKEEIVGGFLYVLDKLSPAEVYPMHAFQSEYLLKEFAQIAKERNYKNNITCVQNKGDHLSYLKTAIAHK
jgi:ankyrin repeat protein